MTNDPPNEYANYTEKALILLTASDDEKAFEILFNSRLDKLLKIAEAELGSPQEAAISVEQTWNHLSMMRKDDCFTDATFWDWLEGITKIKAGFRAADLRRAAKRAAAKPPPPALSPSDELLFVLAKRGNRKAFDSLFKKLETHHFVRALEHQPEPDKAWKYVAKLQNDAFKRLNETDPIHFWVWLKKLRLKRPVNRRAR